MPNNSKPTIFPNFAGKVYKRSAHYKQNVGATVNVDDEDGYTTHAYQYATSSRPGFCQPAAIIYAANESDVKLAIQYAHDAGIAIAIRSGGHQYWGFSSTSGDNIQIDMSNFKKVEYDEISKTITCGVGTQLSTLCNTLAEVGAFVPHGQCGTVRLGGHLQTGGFSVFCGRSHGWFCDYITQFRLITADLKTHIIHKPISDKPDKENDDIWFAVIGGSPGSFGVITELVIKPLWDKDYPESRCSTFYLRYSAKSLEALLQILAEYNDRDDLPADFNISAFVLDAQPIVLRQNIDTKMMKKYPHLYGGRSKPHPAIIGLWATWTNLDGGEYTQQAKDFFAYLKQKIKPHQSLLDKISAKVLAAIFGKVVPIFAPNNPIKMSALSQAFCFPERLHSNPYASGTWCGQSKQLATNGFAKWSQEITAQVKKVSGCYADFEWIVCGGKYSKNKNHVTKNLTASAWRDLTILCFMYVHYDNTNYLGQDWNQPKEFAEAWVHSVEASAIGPNGFIGTENHRWLAFPNRDDSLDRDFKHYFQSEEIYQRVLKVKRKVDPNDIFTPNHFGIAAAPPFESSNNFAESNEECFQ